MKCKRLSDGRSLDHRALQTMRQHAVMAVGQGETATNVANALGVNVRSVFRWLADYATGGHTALRAKPIPGRPQKVTPDEMRWLVQTIKDETPRQYQFEHALWTLASVGEILALRRGKRLSRGSLDRLLRILGYTARKPLSRAWRQDTEALRRWQAEELPTIRAQARAAGAVIYFADETEIRAGPHGSMPVAPSNPTPAPTATALHMISAVSARGDLRFMAHQGNVAAGVFRAFLERLMVGAGQPIYLVLDAHPIHKAGLVTDFVAAQEGRLRLFYLPPLSPPRKPESQAGVGIAGQPGN